MDTLLALNAGLADLVARLGSGLSQNARLLTLASNRRVQRPDNFIVERVTGHEAVNALFRFTVDVLSVDTQLALLPLIGEPFTLRLLLADGQYRAWHGYCTEAYWLGADGGVARYQLRLEPFLAFLQRRRNSFIFQDKNTQGIISALLAGYPQARFRFEVSRDLPVRAICSQYRETDLDFMFRILARDSLSYRFEHDQDGASTSPSTSLQAAHTLVIFDHLAATPALPGGRMLRFAGVRAADDEDAINAFANRSQTVPQAVAASSWLASQVLAPSAEAGGLSPASLPKLGQYVDTGSGQFANTAEADTWANLQWLAHSQGQAMAHGAGAQRRLAPGFGFDLTGHSAFAAGQQGFTLLSVQHEAVNNLGAGIPHTQALADAEDGTYRNRFTAVPETTALLPPADARLPKPVAPGPQTAWVVGLDNSVTTSTRDHQVRVQFHWQRGVAPNPGGLMDTGPTTHTSGHAPGNETSGTWVRVAEALAGPNFGSSFTPRLGTEVLVDFLHGDIDQPVIVASLYNGVDTPPFAAGVDGGLDHAGVVSGWHSQNFSGGGHNQWLLDDAHQELQMQLASSTAHSALNLGFLRARQPASANRGRHRGLGFEARTDAWGHVRGQQGLWLTTAQRIQTGASVQSYQMDVAEAAGQLKQSAEFNQTLRDAAVAQQALICDTALAAVPDLIQKLQPKPSSAAAKALRFASPLIGLDSDASINAASFGSQVWFAQQQANWTTLGDSHWCAQHTVSINSGNASTWFTYAGGITAVTANAALSLAAHTDQLELLADQSITVTSSNASILVEAKQKITLQAGQASITLDGGNITFACPGLFSVKGVLHPFSGGRWDKAVLARLPDSRAKLYDEAFILKDQDTGEILSNCHYRIIREDGSFEYGYTDDKGHTHTIMTADAEKLVIEVLEM